jgi:hypothetical protein
MKGGEVRGKEIYIFKFYWTWEWEKAVRWCWS